MLLRGNLRVMCRIRPFIKSDLINNNNNNSIINNNKIFNKIFNIYDDTISITKNNIKSTYDFDYIFSQRSNQQSIYDEISLLINDINHQSNLCIIAYGQTNTGKSYTIEGPEYNNINDNNFKLRGIIYKSIEELFKIKNNYSEKKFQISITVVEIYNDVIYNLLDENFPVVEIYEDKIKNKLKYTNLKQVIIHNSNEAYNIFKISKKLRIKRQNNYNLNSSRSHIIYTFYIKYINNDDIIKHCKINFIDLAGSERLSKQYGIINDVLKKESQYINLSLNCLNNVLNAIALKQYHIPYRECKLTHFLKESLSNNFNILLILHISPNYKDLNETLSTLDFGYRFCKLCKYNSGEEKRKFLRYNYSQRQLIRSNSFNRNNKMENKLNKSHLLNNSFC